MILGPKGEEPKLLSSDCSEGLYSEPESASSDNSLSLSNKPMNYSRNLVYNNYYYALENAIGNTLKMNCNVSTVNVLPIAFSMSMVLN